MVNTNPATSSSNPARPGAPLAVLAGGEASGSPSVTAEAIVQAEAEAAFGSSPVTGARNPEPSPSTLKFSRRVWRSGEPYYPIKPTIRDEGHWGKLYEKAVKYDKEFCGGWNSEIDALLTFAGLFSAVVTAFTVESYKWLQPDPQDTTNRILMNVSAQLAGRNTTELPSGFTPSPSSLRINALWFLSLTFSLTAGLVGILCKQWLRHYQQDISKPPKQALAFRQFRYDAFLQCWIMEILSALPVLLGIGLILFFVGLIDFLWGLHAKVSIPVTILIGVGFAFLVVTTLAPAFQFISGYLRVLYIARFKTDPAFEADPPLFAFKSPQSLAILHLVTWWFRLPDNLKVPNWASMELILFSFSSVLHTYTGRALTWLDENYCHSLDMGHQICLCLQDIDSESNLAVEGVGRDMIENLTMQSSSAAVIKLLFDPTRSELEAKRAEGHVRRDIIAMRYLRAFTGSWLSNSGSAQDVAVLEYSIRALNASHQLPSFELFRDILGDLSTYARDHPAELLQELIWQRAILVWNLLSEGRWTDSAGIPKEVQNVSENLTLFTDEDLNSIFNALRAWMDQHPQHADLPSQCWVAMTSGPKPHELDYALRDRPPVRDFMAFLDSRFRMGDSVKYSCSHMWHDGERFDPFFKALYAWIGRNPQDTQSFTDCRTLMATMDSWKLGWARDHYQPFRDFEAFLEVQIDGDKDVAELGPVLDP